MLDLGGAHGLLMEIIRFRLPLGIPLAFRLRLPLMFYLCLS